MMKMITTATTTTTKSQPQQQKIGSNQVDRHVFLRRQEWLLPQHQSYNTPTGCSDEPCITHRQTRQNLSCTNKLRRLNTVVCYRDYSGDRDKDNHCSCMTWNQWCHHDHITLILQLHWLLCNNVAVLASSV